MDALVSSPVIPKVNLLFALVWPFSTNKSLIGLQSYLSTDTAFAFNLLEVLTDLLDCCYQLESVG